MKSYRLRLKPEEIFSLFSRQKDCFCLDSSLTRAADSRYSFFGFDPFLKLEIKASDPFGPLRQLLAKYRIQPPKNSPPFLGGAVGYLAYDLGYILEKKIQPLPKEELKTPYCVFGFYNTVAMIDHRQNSLLLCALGFPEKGSLAATLARSNLKKIEKLLSLPVKEIKPPQPTAHCGLKSNFTLDTYCRAIKKAKDYIRKGDIYQVNLSQKFQAQSYLSAPEIYQRLRRISPSSFGAYFDFGQAQILSSSPERFLSLRGNKVLTRPMKGTRRRGKSFRIDQKLKASLLGSAKDKAELMMIVDLERNDLGKVCSYDSVKVTQLRQLEKYSTVYQTTATVEGQLHKNKDRFDLLRACFPGGSITGCPKIRAMEIIDELEPSRRDIYTGSLGYLSFSGSMDFNILIRTILKKDNQLYFGVGGGIVADSRPYAEYRETLVKAKAIFEAIR